MSLVGRAIAGTFPTDPNSIGGKLLGGVIPAGGLPPPRSIKDFLESYSSMPWLRAVASRISYDVAAVEWRLLVHRKQGKAVRNTRIQRSIGDARAKLIAQTQDVEVIEHHPVLDLLDDANSVQTGLQMRRVTQLHIDLGGDGFWLLERGALDVPTAIWPIPPHWILATPTPSRPSFRVGFRGWRGEIPVSEIIWFSDSDPANPYGRGSATAKALGDELETDEYAARHVKAYFYNRARPDLIVWPKGGGTMDENDVERLEDHWTSRNTGFWRAFRPYFLRREVEVKELDQNFRSDQLTQIREHERNTILQVYGVSPETLGIIAPGSARATITMSDQIYAKRVLVPRLELLRSVMQERLLPMFDERLILDYVSPVVRDHELELQAAQAAPWAPNVDEWRARMGLEPLPDGKGQVHVISPLLEERTFGDPEPELEIDDDPLIPPAPQDNADDDEPDDADETEDEDDKAKPKRKRTAYTAALMACRDAGDTDAMLSFSKFHEDGADDPAPTRLAERQVGGYRRSQERAWRAVGARASEAQLMAALPDPDAVVRALGGDKALTAALLDPFKSNGRPAFMRGADLALHALPPRQPAARGPISISLNDVNPRAVRWAELEAARLVANVSADTREAIRALIAQAHAIGLAPQEVARRLRGMVGLLPSQVEAVGRFEERLLANDVSAVDAARRAGKYAEAQLRLRATRIARTELIASTNAGQQALWEEAKERGVLSAQAQRVWIATLDERLEPECEALADVRVGLNEEFTSGVMLPPLHPQCRCAVGIVEP